MAEAEADQSFGVYRAAAINSSNTLPESRSGARVNTPKSGNERDGFGTNQKKPSTAGSPAKPRPLPPSKPNPTSEALPPPKQEQEQERGLLELLAELACLEEKRDNLKVRLETGKQATQALYYAPDRDLDKLEAYEAFWLKLMWQCRRINRRIRELKTIIEPKPQP